MLAPDYSQPAEIQSSPDSVAERGADFVILPGQIPGCTGAAPRQSDAQDVATRDLPFEVISGGDGHTTGMG